MAKQRVFVGIDLAWSDTNPSALAVLRDGEKPELLECGLFDGLDEMDEIIKGYTEKGEVSVGVDAPLVVPNETGNRETEKAFVKDFAKYKIGMLPVNRSLMARHFGGFKGEELLKRLQAEGFALSVTAEKSVAEVYPHSTIAVCFNGNKLLPYKRKKGRNIDDIKAEMVRYQGFLKTACSSHPLFDEDVAALRGQGLKHYEDRLDAVTSAYALWYCRCYPQKCKVYAPKGEAVFVTPIPTEMNRL